MDTRDELNNVGRHCDVLGETGRWTVLAQVEGWGICYRVAPLVERDGRSLTDRTRERIVSNYALVNLS